MSNLKTNKLLSLGVQPSNNHKNLRCTDFSWENINDLHDAFPYLVNNKFLSDVKFHFTTGKQLHAHSFVLYIRSFEFYKFLNGIVGEIKIVPVIDVPYETFWDFLTFIYTDRIRITRYNVEALQRLAIKYRLKSLEIKCINFEREDITVYNACEILQEFPLNELRLKACEEFIGRNYMPILSTKSFLEIKSITLKKILKLDPALPGTAFRIFESFIKWSAHWCNERHCKLSSSVQRQLLGGQVKLIRFKDMSAEDFARCQHIAPDFLNSDEVSKIFLKIMNPNKSIDKYRYFAKPTTSSTQLPSSQSQTSTSSINKTATVSSRSQSQRPNYSSNDNVFVNHACFSVGETLYTASDLKQKFYIEFSTSKTIRLEDFQLFISNEFKIHYDFMECGKKIIQSRTLTVKKGNLTISPITLNPAKRYRLQYNILDIPPQTTLTAKKYELNEEADVKSKSKSVVFKFYKNISHVFLMNFKY